MNINTGNYARYNAATYQRNVQGWKSVTKQNLQFGAAPPKLEDYLENERTKAWFTRIRYHPDPRNATEQNIQLVLAEAHNQGLKEYVQQNPQVTATQMLIKAYKIIDKYADVPADELGLADNADRGR